MITDMKRPLYPQQEMAGRLLQALDDSGVTQARLARECGVTDQAVHGWVTNGRIGKQHFASICRLTGKGLEYFFVGLKTFRRAAAIALVLTVPQIAIVVDALQQIGCVLCQIVGKPLTLTRSAVRFITSLCPIGQRNQYSIDHQ